MATSKQPRFPNPPLEWGVPQYPTPNVPDFYTKDGHIILVEKVSTEKGPYNPQPLDGSITYSKRDANKWPSTLYLVYQKPDETGQFVYNYYANDRTLASQDAWNFGLDYSANNPAYPITSRTYIVPRSQYETVALGTHDPIFGGNQIIAQQKKVELGDDNPLHSRYVAVQRVYETIPGPVLTGQKLDERGDLETITTQTVVAGTAPAADGLLVTQTSVQPVDSVKSTKTTGTVEGYTTLFTKAKKAGLLGTTSTTDDIVPPSTEPDALSTTVLESSVDALTATKSRKRTTTSSGPTELDSKEKKGGLLGETTIAQSIVAYGSSPDSLSTSVISSSVEAIDSSKSKKTTITSTGPTSLASPSKKGGLLGEISVVESIVAAGSSPDSLSTTVLSSEVTAIDSAKSKKTTTTATGPTSLTGDDKKAGLLGITETIESIVAAGSTPDDLSTTILQSSVIPIDSAKSKKTTITATGPTLLGGVAKKEGLLGTTTVEQSIVTYGSSADNLSETVLSSEVTPIDSYKSKKVTTTSSGPTELDGKTIGEFGLITTAESIVSYGSALPNPTTTTVKLDKSPIDLAKAKLTNASYDSTETLDGYQYDADLGLVVHTTKDLIAEGSSPLSITNGIIAYKDEPIDAWKSVRIVSRISELPATRTEYRTGAYASPNLVTGFNVSAPQMPNWDINVSVTPVMRAKRSYQTVFKHITSYQYGQPTPSYTLFDPIAINVYYDGYFFKVNIPDALTNSGLYITFTTASNDPVHGYVNETYNVPVSSTTADQYNALVGTYQLIAFEADYWKANIWRVVQQLVLLK